MIEGIKRKWFTKKFCKYSGEIKMDNDILSKIEMNCKANDNFKGKKDKYILMSVFPNEEVMERAFSVIQTNEA
ncbi:MAG TPA: hypothetical protein H9761_05835 [Candidatus Eisenbergiella merdavium]|uniref:Uncharacterized protein n=1 Tax=Candidatus Eisenbergiella merdavium TaxID=2838551 RepID=A0A9D2NGC3_9FIRM|nr:hypothetical protein [Candidatus Eisenbergiella merdavium]